MQESLEGQPFAAAQRPLFHQHIPRMPKGNLSAEAHSRAQQHEADRVKRLMEERYVVALKFVTALLSKTACCPCLLP